MADDLYRDLADRLPRAKLDRYRRRRALAEVGLAAAQCAHRIPLVDDCEECTRELPTGYRQVGPGCPCYREAAQ